MLNEKKVVQLIDVYFELHLLYNLKCPVHVQISRLVTGCLMIADSWDAYQKVGGRASRYIREVVIDYLDTLKLLS
jgi:hypothetical protein